MEDSVTSLIEEGLLLEPEEASALLDELQQRVGKEGIFPGFIEALNAVVVPMVCHQIACAVVGHPVLDRIDKTCAQLGKKITVHISALPVAMVIANTHGDPYDSSGLYL